MQTIYNTQERPIGCGCGLSTTFYWEGRRAFLRLDLEKEQRLGRFGERSMTISVLGLEGTLLGVSGEG